MQKYSKAKPPKPGQFMISSAPDARGFVVAHQKRQGEEARLELLLDFDAKRLQELRARQEAVALKLAQLREKVRK